MDQAQTPPVLGLPEELLLKVFMLLPLQSVRCVSLTCARFMHIARDDQLWKRLFQRDFKVPQLVPLRPKACSWRAEYRRLYDETPAVLCEEVLQHEDEVWHVCFSHDGQMFCTSSKDGTVRLWNATTPCTLTFCADMRARFGWQYAQCCVFNKTDTLLLASGISNDQWEGEIVIFELKQGFRPMSRFSLEPYDVHGAWYDDTHLLSGTHFEIIHAEATSVVWLAKATREVKSKRKYAMINPFRFKNIHNFSMGTIMVADVPIVTESAMKGKLASSAHDVPPTALKQISADLDDTNSSKDKHVHSCCDGYSNASDLASKNSYPSPAACKQTSGISGNVSTEKLLIMLLSEDTFTRHSVGIKRMTEDEILEEEEAMEGLRWPETEEGLLPHEGYELGGTRRTTNLDCVFNMHGRIVGIALSPDHRYLYVNRRRWPDNYEILDPGKPPPIAEEVDIHVIDLVTFTKVDTILDSHKAYTTNDNCFRIYLDVCELYVASGAEDNQGYMWDRHYGVHVRCFPHDNVVNCCAFNPVDPEMLVTVGDDNKIKIWRSRRQMREMPVMEG